MTLRERIKLAEGPGPMKAGRHMAYRDSLGVLTIGFGFNLEAGCTPKWLVIADGITRAQANALLDLKLAESLRDARTFAWFESLTPTRQDAIVEMLYQLGLSRFRGFGRMIAALKAHDYERASLEILNSVWAKVQTPSRAQRIAAAIRTGEPQ